MLQEIPTTLRAGDTWKWKSAFADYPASEGWALSTAFRGEVVLDVAAVADGDAWISTATATATAGVAAGRYTWVSRVTKDGEVYTVGSGVIEILPNLAAQSAGYDGRTDAEKQLAAAEASLTALLSKKSSSVSFGDQSYTIQDIEKLKRVRDELRQQVTNEKAAANGSKRSSIKIHFPSC